MAPRERRRMGKVGRASCPRKRAPRRCLWSVCTRRKLSWSTSFSAQTPTSAQWSLSLRWDPDLLRLCGLETFCDFIQQLKPEQIAGYWWPCWYYHALISTCTYYFQQMWVFDDEIGMNTREITYVPGLYKIFDEILGKLMPWYASQFSTSHSCGSGVQLTLVGLYW